MHQRGMRLSFRFRVCLRSVEPLSGTFKWGHLCSDSHCHGNPVLNPSLVFGLWFLFPRKNAKSKAQRPKSHLLVQSLLTWLPLRLAETTRLQCLNDSQGLFCRSAHIEIVYYFVTKYAFRINHEQTT